MVRSLWKGNFIAKNLRETKVNKIWFRSSVITSDLVGQSFQVYNGKKFILVRILPDMVGHKFGEFSLTRKSKVKKSKT